MAEIQASVRGQVLPALALAAAAQLVIAVGGNLFPDVTGAYGAPLPVGDSSGLNQIFLSGVSTFSPPVWLLDVALTAVSILAVAVLLHGRIALGLPAVMGAPIVAYAAVGAFRVSEGRTNQLLVWAWTLAALAIIWALVRVRRRTP